MASIAEDPNVAIPNVHSLGLKGVLGYAPPRQMDSYAGRVHIRELDAIALSNQPVRIMVMAITGTSATVKVLIVINLYRWPEFISHCLQFVGGINLSGNRSSSLPLTVSAIVDRNHPEQIEFGWNDPLENSFVPITSLPTEYEGTIIINHNYYGNVNHDESINIDEINGTSVSVGSHSTSRVT